MQLIDFQFFHGGVMETEPEYLYKGGDVALFHSLNCDLTCDELNILIKNLGGHPVLRSIIKYLDKA